jgi:hypothetical protein
LRFRLAGLRVPAVINNRCQLSTNQFEMGAEFLRQPLEIRYFASNKQ